MAHAHSYERILRDGLVYFVNGLGGGPGIYNFGTPVPGSNVRYNQDYGAMLCEASANALTCQFIARTGQVIDTYTIAARPAAVLVGQVAWEGRPPSSAIANQLPITLTLRQGATVMHYADQQTDASGAFTVPVTILPTGVYTWWVKGPQFLATMGTVTLTGTPSTTLALGVQRTGDANDDNVVDIADFSLLRASFGRACGAPGYDGRAEFTGDCVVDISDFTLLRGNFGQAGAPP